MGEMNRWKVTYTKHLKQKRKVYHDGFLDIHRSSNKTMLYDECEKLLECRLLKKDEVICSGETLIFNSYLVDIDTPQEDHKPESGLNFQAGDDKISEKSGVLRGKNFRNNSVCSASAEKNETRPTLSPSHKIIREFKKSRLKCYGSPQSSPDTRKTEETEWQVLYTSQITQKSKKYHNGIIRISSSGSHHMQATLLNEDRVILSSKHISLSKNLMTGEILELPKYLVEVGEACGSVKVELGNRNYDIRKDRSFCISGEDEKGSGGENMKKTLRDAHEILSILQRPKARVSLSSGQTDENISASISSYKAPEPSLAEASHLPIDDGSHQKPSENLDTRESTKNAENNQSIALTQSTFTGNARTLTEDVEIGHSSQPLQSDHVEAESSSLKNSISRTEGSSDSAACDLVNDEGKICEEIPYEREIDACPSFDLGI